MLSWKCLSLEAGKGWVDVRCMKLEKEGQSQTPPCTARDEEAIHCESHPQKDTRTANQSLLPRRPPFLRVESDGTLVTSSILPIRMPARASARSADCAPGPGVLEPVPPVARSLM